MHLIFLMFTSVARVAAFGYSLCDQTFTCTDTLKILAGVMITGAAREIILQLWLLLLILTVSLKLGKSFVLCNLVDYLHDNDK